MAFVEELISVQLQVQNFLGVSPKRAFSLLLHKQQAREKKKQKIFLEPQVWNVRGD